MKVDEAKDRTVPVSNCEKKDHDDPERTYEAVKYLEEVDLEHAVHMTVSSDISKRIHF